MPTPSCGHGSLRKSGNHSQLLLARRIVPRGSGLGVPCDGCYNAPGLPYWVDGGSKVTDHQWIEEFPGTIMVCDTQGIILEMNERSAQAYHADGGRALIGHNVLDCHPEPARTRLQQLMETQQTNVYTIEKRGVRKLIYQAPWYRDGQYAGFVELAFEIPATLPHFVRDKLPGALS